MTNDLISRTELLTKAIRVTETDEGGWERVLRAVPVEEIEKAEAVDAAPVVRCVDCRHSAVDSGTERLMCVRMGEIRPNGHVWGGTAVREEHFCGYGARMDKEADNAQI